MRCKNCEHSLRTDYSYCPNCGAKVIRNRITFRNLWYDIIERYFNLDNTFLKTFIHLLKKPELVIEGYIYGTRRKYLNPIGYIAIALTLSGISLFIMKNYAWDKIDFDGIGGRMSSEAVQKIMNFSLDYNSFIYLMYVPIIAMVGYLTFNKKNYFLSEHLVASLYILANFSILSFFFSTIFLLVSPENYFQSSFLVIAFIMIYSIYVYARVSNFGLSKNIIRGFAYFALFTIGFFGVSISLNIIMLVLGVIEPKDLLPK